MALVRGGLVVAQENEDANARDEEDGGEDDDKGDEPAERAPDFRTALFHVRALLGHDFKSTKGFLMHYLIPVGKVGRLCQWEEWIHQLDGLRVPLRQCSSGVSAL